MSSHSNIEWTDATWNPVTGCDKVSQGCKICYAETLANRHFGEWSKSHARKFTDVMLHPDKLELPLHWRRPRRVFVTSVSDLFHGNVPDEFITQVFGIMMRTPRHTYQILTKRPERMTQFLNDSPSWKAAPNSNVWLGISCEDQKTANERIPLLLQTPAAVRWVSAEPLLGPIDFSKNGSPWDSWLSPCSYYCDHDSDGGGHRPERGLDWLVVGGESGHGARPMQPEWARSLRDQCISAGVPFFFKQWGEWAPSTNPSRGSMARIGKKRAGMLLDGRAWNEYPTMSVPRDAQVITGQREKMSTGEREREREGENKPTKQEGCQEE